MGTSAFIISCVPSFAAESASDMHSTPFPRVPMYEDVSQSPICIALYCDRKKLSLDE